jgi:hypothetical protein
MSTIQDSHHASFGARGRAGGVAPARVAALDASDNLVSMHRVAQLVRRNEEVAVDVFSWRIGNHKAVSIAMRDKPTREKIGISRGWPRRGPRGGSGFCYVARFSLGARETISAASQLVYEALALQSR